MPRHRDLKISLTDDEKACLRRGLRQWTLPQGLARRYQAVLLFEEGHTYKSIEYTTHLTRTHIAKIVRLCQEGGIARLADRRGKTRRRGEV